MTVQMTHYEVEVADEDRGLALKEANRLVLSVVTLRDLLEQEEVCAPCIRKFANEAQRGLDTVNRLVFGEGE